MTDKKKTTREQDRRLDRLRAGLRLWLIKSAGEKIDHDLVVTALMLFTASSAASTRKIGKEDFLDMMGRYFDMYSTPPPLEQLVAAVSGAAKVGARVRAPTEIVYPEDAYGQDATTIAAGSNGTITEVDLGGALIHVKWDGNQAGLRTSSDSVEFLGS